MYFVHFNKYFVGPFFPGSAEADIEWSGKLAGHLMASCARNICIKMIKNW